MLIQCGALPLTLAILYVMASFRLPVDYLRLALLQGLIAALLTWKFGLAAWWRAIQLLFPLAVLTTLALHLPSWLFGAGFLLLLGWYWSTFRTQVPYYPSGPAVWDAVRQLLPPPATQPQQQQPQQPLRVIDIGSGLGGLTLYLARVRPDVEALGIELAPLPWLVSWLRARFSGGRARFLRGDYESLDFSQFALVFAYLSPAAMSGLWRKAAAEMCPGSILCSYEFIIAERSPDRIIHATKGGVPLYIWCF